MFKVFSEDKNWASRIYIKYIFDHRIIRESGMESMSFAPKSQIWALCDPKIHIGPEF